LPVVFSEKSVLFEPLEFQELFVSPRLEARHSRTLAFHCQSKAISIKMHRILEEGIVHLFGN